VANVYFNYFTCRLCIHRQNKLRHKCLEKQCLVTIIKLLGVKSFNYKYINNKLQQKHSDDVRIDINKNNKVCISSLPKPANVYEEFDDSGRS
jgi:hypothetical protein